AQDVDMHLADLAERTVLYQPPDGPPGLEVHRRWHDLSDEVRMAPRRLEHGPRLDGVHRHARLDEDVLAGVEGSDGVFGVPVRPGADTDGIDVRIAEDGVRLRVDVRDAELVRDALPTLLGAIADGHDRH